MFYAANNGRSEQAHVATSIDGMTWTISPANPLLARSEWHDYHTRISSVVPAPDCPAWLVFYKRSSRADYGEICNLRTGGGLSWELTDVIEVITDGPWLSAPAADEERGLKRFDACRYLDIR